MYERGTKIVLFLLNYKKMMTKPIHV